MFFLLGTMPVYAVIQDRGVQTTPATSMNDDILSSIANLDKTLSALNSKLPTLIESRFNYYESIQRQNQVKQVIAQLGAFIIALMIYALIRNKNDREKERALTRSEQILTNIETRIQELENSDEVTVKLDESKPHSKSAMFDCEKNDVTPVADNKEPTKMLSVLGVHQKHYILDEKINPDELYCPSCVSKMNDKNYDADKFRLCALCIKRLDALIELQNMETKLIKKQLKLGFCKPCEEQVKYGGLQRGFVLCPECIKILSPKPKDKVLKSFTEQKDKDIIGIIEITNPKKKEILSKTPAPKRKVKSASKSEKKTSKSKKDKFLGIDDL